VGIKAIARPIKQCEQLHDIKNLALAHEKADIYFKRFKEDQYLYLPVVDVVTLITYGAKSTI
jgi:hypothetical protein